MSKLNITITGDLGSGKSSIAKELCKMLDYKYFSTGMIQRQIGKEKGMNTLELNYFSEGNESIDKYIDDLVIKLNDDEEPYVIDSRMAWHFINNSFKIYLTTNPIIAARRVNSDNHRDNEPLIEDIYKKSLNLLERRAAEDKRFKIKYGVDCSDLNNFDLVIDTTIPAIEEISRMIFQLYLEFSKKATINKFWVSPKILFPTKHVRKPGHEEVRTMNHIILNEGYDNASIIETVKLKKDLFIWDGHKRVSAYIFNNIPLIPVYILAKDEEEIQSVNTVSSFVENSCNLSLIFDWENIHGFRFVTYPLVKKNTL
jgi:cytidylate kinase